MVKSVVVPDKLAGLLAHRESVLLIVKQAIDMGEDLAIGGDDAVNMILDFNIAHATLGVGDNRKTKGHTFKKFVAGTSPTAHGGQKQPAMLVIILRIVRTAIISASATIMSEEAR